MKFLITFIILSIVNVIFSTIRSIVTINGSKIMASLISGGYFAFYNIMMIYTVADFPMWQKCVITFKVPTGSRDGDAYDGYSVAEEYAIKQKLKAEKAIAAAKAKEKKIAKDKAKKGVK